MPISHKAVTPSEVLNPPIKDENWMMIQTINRLLSDRGETFLKVNGYIELRQSYIIGEFIKDHPLYSASYIIEEELLRFKPAYTIAGWDVQTVFYSGFHPSYKFSIAEL